MGYDRAAPKRPVNTTLNEDLVRRARVLTPNLSEIAESLLAAYVDDAEAQMVRREQKIAAHISASDAFATRYRALADNSAPCDAGSAQRSPQPQPEPARRSIRRRPGQPRRPVVPLVQPRRSVRQTAISGQIS
jgi:antitoxin CcdA